MQIRTFLAHKVYVSVKKKVLKSHTITYSNIGNYEIKFLPEFQYLFQHLSIHDDSLDILE